MTRTAPKTATLCDDLVIRVDGVDVGAVRETRRGFRALLNRSRVPTQSTFATARAAAEVVAMNASAELL